ncbi:MAG: hypothetical protein RL757_3309 [Bacteroidota bacterium]|jgi:hypothetical protein
MLDKEKNRRIDPSYKQKIRLLKEAEYCCPFCGYSESDELQFHHIDEDRSNTIDENLIAICPNCHVALHAGKITSEQVIKKKSDVKMTKLFNKKQEKEMKINNKKNVVNQFNGNNNVINFSPKVINKKIVNKKIINKYPAESIGSDVSMYNYAQHLAHRYAEFQNLMPNEKFNYPRFYKKVMNDFKVGGFFHIPRNRFMELVQYLQTKIDGTKLGKINKSKGYKNYSTFEECSNNNDV